MVNGLHLYSIFTDPIAKDVGSPDQDSDPLKTFEEDGSSQATKQI